MEEGRELCASPFLLPLLVLLLVLLLLPSKAEPSMMEAFSEYSKAVVVCVCVCVCVCERV